MDILREKIIAAIRSGTWPTNDEQVEGIEEAADAILAIPELKEALLLMDTAQRRFGEAVRQTDPSAMMADAYRNSHPWANLLKAEDMPK